MSTYKGFSTVQLTKPQRSLFDLSHTKKLTARMGKLIPILCAETIPGDSFKGSSQVLTRLLALLAPVYADMSVTVHYFFVPNRLLWAEWEDFITTGRLGEDIGAGAPLPPTVRFSALLSQGEELLNNGSLGDYLGIPRVPDADLAPWSSAQDLDAMPFAAYQLIYEEYYRDRNFEADDLIGFPLSSGVQTALDAVELARLRVRDWAPDYFTTSLPFTQRGSEVLIPMEGTVSYLDISRVKKSTGGGGSGDSPLNWDNTAGALAGIPAGTGASSARIENIDSIDNTSITINDFRSAMQLQAWLERNAVAGSRYVENIQAFFGVKPQDYRLQRPEYLGGGRVPIKITEIVTTAFSENEAAEVVPAGNMAGHGRSFGDTNMFSYYCQEHGFVMGILSIMTPPSYQQGLPRMFRRRSFLDYVWPTFAKLGEQEVHKWELYLNPTNYAQDADGNWPLFGYQSRYADWKWIPSTSHGDFRDSLLFWTLTRVFASSPTLGTTFLSMEDTLQDRIFAVTGNNFLLYVSNRLTVVRALPYFGTPASL